LLFDANNFGKVNKIAGHAKATEVFASLPRCIERVRLTLWLRLVASSELAATSSLCSPPSKCAGFIRDDVETEFGVREIRRRLGFGFGTIAESFDGSRRNSSA
jgi:hypothetical protein